VFKREEPCYLGAGSLALPCRPYLEQTVCEIDATAHPLVKAALAENRKFLTENLAQLMLGAERLREEEALAEARLRAVLEEG